MNDASLRRSLRRGASVAAPDDERSPVPRRVRRPSWFDTRFVAGLALVVASVLLGARLLASAQHTVAFVAVAHDVADGTVLGADDVVVVRGAITTAPRGGYAGRVDEVVGRRTSRTLAAGELVPRSAITDPPALTWLEVPLDQDAAPPLSVGQRITLWLTTDHCAPVVVVPDVAVQHLRPASGGPFATNGGQAVEIAVPPDSADRVLAALAQATSEHGALRAGIRSGAHDDQSGAPLPPPTCPEAS